MKKDVGIGGGVVRKQWPTTISAANCLDQSSEIRRGPVKKLIRKAKKRKIRKREDKGLRKMRWEDKRSFLRHPRSLAVASRVSVSEAPMRQHDRDNRKRLSDSQRKVRKKENSGSRSLLLVRRKEEGLKYKSAKVTYVITPAVFLKTTGS